MKHKCISYQEHHVYIMCGQMKIDFKLKIFRTSFNKLKIFLVL